MKEITVELLGLTNEEIAGLPDDVKEGLIKDVVGALSDENNYCYHAFLDYTRKIIDSVSPLVEARKGLKLFASYALEMYEPEIFHDICLETRNYLAEQIWIDLNEGKGFPDWVKKSVLYGMD